MAPVSDKASQLIVAKVTIAGVRVAALVDTGATTSCCRWGWYQKWKSNLGSLKQSSTVVVGVGNVPVEVKGLSQPLSLQWDNVEGQCQLMVLTTLTDVDVIAYWVWTSSVSLVLGLIVRNKQPVPLKNIVPR